MAADVTSHYGRRVVQFSPSIWRVCVCACVLQFLEGFCQHINWSQQIVCVCVRLRLRVCLCVVSSAEAVLLPRRGPLKL